MNKSSSTLRAGALGCMNGNQTSNVMQLQEFTPN